jgi:hypothetical protein
MLKVKVKLKENKYPIGSYYIVVSNTLNKKFTHVFNVGEIVMVAACGISQYETILVESDPNQEQRKKAFVQIKDIKPLDKELWESI